MSLEQNLTQSPTLVDWPETYYVYIERIGPFHENARQAWQQLHALMPKILERNEVRGSLSLYDANPSKMIYRAGVALAAPGHHLAPSLQAFTFAGGRFAKFTLKGSYAQLPEACGRAFQIFTDAKLPRREDFCIEHYVNDPSRTPESDLLTEILIPTN